MFKKILIVQLFLILIAIGLLVFYFRTRALVSRLEVVSSATPIQLSKPEEAASSGQYPLFDPEVATHLEKHFIANFKSLKEDLIDIQKKQMRPTYVYFLYLNDSSVIDLNMSGFFTASSTVDLYSDCQMNYVPTKPYLLCVGSDTASVKQKSAFIGDVSRTVHEYVINN